VAAIAGSRVELPAVDVVVAVGARVVSNGRKAPFYVTFLAFRFCVAPFEWVVGLGVVEDRFG
jgi:hypothetical protein